jgi:hypothetical protein
MPASSMMMFFVLGLALSGGAAQGPRDGSAMMQIAREEGTSGTLRERIEEAQRKSAKTRTKDAPMKGRLETVEKEIGSLKARVASLEGDVGVSGGAMSAGGAAPAPAPAPPPAVEEEAAPEEMVFLTNGPGRQSTKASLLAEATITAEGASLRTGAIKDRIATAESDVSLLMSKVAVLENQVAGGLESSLLQEGEDKGGKSNFVARLEGLEADTKTLRKRVSILEHTVKG